MLTIQIDSAGLSAIYAAGQTVTLARRVQTLTEASVSLSWIVAWQAFQPLQTNTVTWTSDCYAFATTTPPGLGVAIQVNSISGAPLRNGTLATFQDGYFLQTSQSSQSYAIENNSNISPVYLGLSQAACINQTSILNPCVCMPVLTGESVYFDPLDKISIFLSSCQSGGAFIIQNSNWLQINGSQPATIGFNDTTNQFFQIS